MSNDIDVTTLSDEELENIINDKETGTKRIPAKTEFNAPQKGPSGEYYEAKPDGSFWEGAGGQLKSYAMGVGRMLGDVSEEKMRQHEAEMARQHSTGRGAIGAGAANAAVSMALPFGPGKTLLGLTRNALVGGAGEALSDYGEGKAGADAALQGGTRGAVGTIVGNLALNAGAKLANAGLRKAGVRGRWASPEDEYIYDFAKSKGVDLRSRR
jgi:hypothetical protein